MRLILEMSETESRTLSVERRVAEDSAMPTRRSEFEIDRETAQDAGPPAPALLMALGAGAGTGTEAGTEAGGGVTVESHEGQSAGGAPDWLTEFLQPGHG